ncbi:hypothetical protein SV7mr_36270 [Stieleria bergensis]|uniref:Type II secretion system protein H n=1 Tax=Stieleria bergensis TaxID=2528025 RepID=A0A517SY71_9BACT|nr:hypothetical protein SV7mr_36270 [Planctomycetes bacterium SV_7m_r]
MHSSVPLNQPLANGHAPRAMDPMRTASPLGQRQRSVLSRGFTVLELLLVLSVMAIIAAGALPQVLSLLSDRRLVRGSRIVREEMLQTRIDAMRQGRTLIMDAELETGTLRVRPYQSLADAVNAIDQTGSQEALLTGSDQGMIATVDMDEPTPEEIELPEEVTIESINVVSAARALEVQQTISQTSSGQSSSPILFYADGTTSTASVTLAHPTHGQITIKLRGVTGDVTLGEVEGSDQ